MSPQKKKKIQLGNEKRFVFLLFQPPYGAVQINIAMDRAYERVKLFGSGFCSDNCYTTGSSAKTYKNA